MRKITKTISDTQGNTVQSEHTISSEGNSSVEITVDSKGMIKPTVKVYDDDPTLARDMAVVIWNQLKDKFGDKMLGEKSTGRADGRNTCEKDLDGE